MKIVHIILIVIPVFLLTNCGLFKKDNPYEVSEYSKPSHRGYYVEGKKGIYLYQAYAESVSFKAPDIVMCSEIDVYDLDSNKKFDTVFVLTDGKYMYGSTSELRKQYKMVKPTLSSKIMMHHIKEATEVAKIAAKQRAQKLKTQGEVLQKTQVNINTFEPDYNRSQEIYSVP